MSAPTIAIATVTLVRDAEEDVLLRQSLTALVRLGMPVVVADGGSGGEFVSFLQDLAVQVVPPEGNGLVAQVAAAVRRADATGAELVLYTESDKRSFFESGLPDFIRCASEMRAGSVRTVGSGPPLVLASRTPAAYMTFPPVQRYTETTINDLCSESFGVPGDYSYGPFLMHRSLVPWIERLPADLGWGWRHFTFAVGRRLGHRIAHVAAELACPPDQRDEDDRQRVHRLRQLDQNLSGLQLGLVTHLASE